MPLPWYGLACASRGFARAQDTPKGFLGRERWES
jgi:hypothetical protein